MHLGPRSWGTSKIKACCARAVEDGLEYVWIDTCCIDKTNGVELQEAINSMFSGWHVARRGFVLGEQVVYSRWTLQELIAPSNVVFYDRLWDNIGSKTDLRDLISGITRISPEVLAGQDLGLSSVAQRMSWASMRKTTRAEDMAYCLLGIFGVNIPLIYGEGGREAFIRLQETIMVKSDDHSLFAWKQ